MVGWLVQQRVVVAALAWCGGGGSTGLGLVLDENNVTINRRIGHPLACSGAVGWLVESTTNGSSTGLVALAWAWWAWCWMKTT